MLTRLSIETLVCEAKALDWLPSDDMRIDDLVDISLSDVAVPDSFGIDDDVRSVLALVQTSGLVRADAPFQSSLG